MTFFHIYLLLKLKCLFEKTKINEKEAQDGPFFLKKINQLSLRHEDLLSSQHPHGIRN